MAPQYQAGSATMSDEGRDHFEIPKDMRSMAEASFDQARKAFEKFLSSAQATAGTIEERGATVRAGAKDIGAKAIAYAEKNVQASLDYAESLLHAKDLSEIMKLHSEYVQSQMRSLAEQASEMGQIVSRAAMDAAKPKS
jgi:phasin